VQLEVYVQKVVKLKGKKDNMPVRKVKGGFRWGKHGKVYRSKKKARLQGIAIIMSEKRIGLR